MKPTDPSIRTLVELTPDSRDRVVDLLRAVAILAVVVGHWMAVVVVARDGTLSGGNALGMWPPAQLLSWLWQVMPLFFLVGGYAGMASWQSARAKGRPALGWLADRLHRLLRPTTVFLAAVLVGAAVARLFVDSELVGTAAWLVSIPLWFLAVYVAVVAATPLLVAAHDRLGLVLPLALIAMVTAVDVLRLAVGVAWIGALNYLLVWLCLYALGLCWRAGTLLSSPLVPATLLAGGGLVAIGLVALGPYPVSMLGVPGQDFQNTAPPSLALLALGVAQAGVVLLARAPLARSCRWRPVWVTTVAVNATTLTLYLWHLVPVLVVAPALYLTDILPQPEALTAGWFALRPVWVVSCAAVLGVLVLAVGRFERPSGWQPAPAAVATPMRGAAAALGVATICAGLAHLTVAGVDAVGQPITAATTAALYTLGLVIVRVAVRPRQRMKLLS